MANYINVEDFCKFISDDIFVDEEELKEAIENNKSYRSDDNDITNYVWSYDPHNKSIVLSERLIECENLEKIIQVFKIHEILDATAK